MSSEPTRGSIAWLEKLHEQSAPLGQLEAETVRVALNLLADQVRKLSTKLEPSAEGIATTRHILGFEDRTKIQFDIMANRFSELANEQRRNHEFIATVLQSLENRLMEHLSYKSGVEATLLDRVTALVQQVIKLSEREDWSANLIGKLAESLDAVHQTQRENFATRQNYFTQLTELRGQVGRNGIILASLERRIPPRKKRRRKAGK